MWSCCRERFDWTKEECGLTFRRCFERRYDDSCRLDAALSASRPCDLPDRRLVTVLRINQASIAGEELHCVEIEAVALGLILLEKTAY